MIAIRKSTERGISQSDWLLSAHTFSFADYYDPEFLNFGPLRVINEDIINPGKGFGMHAHQHMEIITYVVSGMLEHKDSLHNGSQISPGEIQRMSAGHGVKHSEFNPSLDKNLHLLQIWIKPNADLEPSYEQKNISIRFNEFILIGAEKGNSQVVTIHQDVKIFVVFLNQGNNLEYPIKASRKVWLQLIKGDIQLNEEKLHPGDGAAITDEALLRLLANTDAELLLFDLPS